MLAVPVVDEIFWNNAGTAALTTLASGSVLWIVPSAAGAGTVTTSSAATQWKKIYLGGNVDELVVQYRSKIIAIGGLTNVTGPNITIGAVAQMMQNGDADLDSPHAIDYAPSAFTANGTLGKQGNTLQAMAWDAGVGPVVSGHDNAVLASGGLFQLLSPNVVNGRYGWTIQIGKRLNSAAVGGAANAAPLLSVSGIEAVWISIGTFMTMAGTLATTQLKAEIRVKGLKYVQETITTRQTSFGPGLNIAATA